MIISENTRSKLRDILSVMLPIFVTQLAVMGMSFFDTVMSGQAGAADLAGVAIGSNIWMPIFTSLNGILIALMPIVAQHVGAGRRQEISHAVMQGIYLAFIIGAIVIIAVWFFIDDALVIMKLEPNVQRIAAEYLKALTLGIIPIFICSILRGFVDTLGYTSTTMRIFLLTLPLNVIFNYIMIFGKFGFPRLGGVGAGYATSLSYLLVCLFFLFVINRIDKLRSYHAFSSWRQVSVKLLKEHLHIGIPIGISIFFETSIFGVVALFMAKFGTIAIAAHQAAINFTSLLYMLPLSFSLAMTILVGIKVGAKEYDEAAAYGRIGIMTNLTLALFFVLLLAFGREYVAMLYSQDQEIIKLAGEFLFYAAFFQLLDGTATPIQGILRGYKDVKAAFYASLFAYWGICLPLGYILDVYLGHGPYSYWQSLITGIFFSAAFLLIRLRSMQRKCSE
ncbi:MAG: MATE family efflux transporter [Acholeplasmataceae bacterium]|nr:MATE family efflux transporter [Acholeplasmataceae bacterium]